MTNKTTTDILIQDIRSKFGNGSVFTNKDNPLPEVQFIPTSSPNLNYILGGGIGQGRIVEIFGESSTGKTTISANVLASLHQSDPNNMCGFIDTEAAIDPKYFTNIGVDMDRLLISQPDYGEQALDILDMMVRSGTLKCIIFDSVAGIVPMAELEGEIGDAQVGLQARLMGKSLRKLASLANKTGTTVIFTNQMRANISQFGYGPKTVVPGGKALAFFASQRLELKRIGDYKVGDEIVGTKIKAQAKKNKLAPPFKDKEIIISFGKGLNTAIEIVETAIKKKIIKRNGAWLVYKGENMKQGVIRTSDYLEENPKIKEEIITEINNS